MTFGLWFSSIDFHLEVLNKSRHTKWASLTHSQAPQNPTFWNDWNIPTFSRPCSGSAPPPKTDQSNLPCLVPPPFSCAEWRRTGTLSPDDDGASSFKGRPHP
jgi:hypothetical protein